MGPDALFYPGIWAQKQNLLQTIVPNSASSALQKPKHRALLGWGSALVLFRSRCLLDLRAFERDAVGHHIEGYCASHYVAY